MSNFRELLQNRQQLLLDGGMGTELYKRGLFINRCFEEANLSSKDLVKSIHRDYLKAGAQVLTTNSWGANYLKLKNYNLHDKIIAINQSAVNLAKEVATADIHILGSIGPLGLRIEPFGAISFAEAQAYFQEQAQALIQAGVHAIALETFYEASEIEQGILGIRACDSEIPIIASMVIKEDGTSIYGTPIADIMQRLQELPIDAAGLNCSVGPQPMMEHLASIQGKCSKPIYLRPNAGLPKLVDGRQIYMSTPEYLAHFTQEFFRAGVCLVGGCCGTAPEHIKAMANSQRHAAASKTPSKKKIEISNAPESQPVLFAEKSKWSRAIANGEKVYSIELLPPASIDPSKIIAKAKTIKAAGIHAINLPDGPRASARMSALLTAIMIEQQAGIETVLHYTCRDRNLLCMQSDILGAQAIGLRNLLLVTGDPPKLGSYPDATGVFDVDAIGLTHMVNRLNHGYDLGERSIGKAASLSIGVGVNPAHHDFEYEMRRFAWKVEAGAEWAITQPVFDIEAMKYFLEYLDKQNLSIPIVAGIWPLTSYRNAIFMNNEVPGIVIPEPIIERMQHTKTPEESKKEGVEIAREMLFALDGLVAGFQVSAPFGRIDLALQMLPTISTSPDYGKSTAFA